MFTFREDGASELISVCLRLKYDPLPIGGIVGTDKNGNPNDTRMEVTPVEESVWLVEQRAAAATKPGARRPCLAEKDRSWGRQIGSEEVPSILVVWRYVGYIYIRVLVDLIAYHLCLIRLSI